MIISKNNILQKEKISILYDCFYKKTNTPKPIIIFCHGYKGFKDWGAWDTMATYFAEAGFFFIKFNFSHNGCTINNPENFDNLDAFAKNNYSLELDDLDKVITHFNKDNTFSNEADKKSISLIGHSRGGGIVIIKAEEDNRISNVITWAGVSDYKSRFNIGTEQFKQWEETGRFYVKNGRTNQQMPHDWQFYTNFQENEKRLTISRAAKNLAKPWLIIHGDNDNSVTLDEAEKLNNWNPQSKLEIILHSNHVFGASHPWNKKELPDHLKQVIEKTISFIKQ